jgi:hypothetical protein
MSGTGIRKDELNVSLIREINRLKPRLSELEADNERLKTLLADRESTIVSQQEELWRLRDIVGGRW